MFAKFKAKNVKLSLWKQPTIDFVPESKKAVNIFHITWMKHSHHSFSLITATSVVLTIYVLFLLVLVH